MKERARPGSFHILDAIFVLVPIAFVVFTLSAGSHPRELGSIGQLERVSYTPHAESFFYYVPLLCYCFVLPVYYAFRRQKILATILIGLCLILSLQMALIGAR